VHAEIGLYTGNVVGVPSLAEDSPYRISLRRTGDGAGAAWLAEVEGLPDCSARGATPEEAVQRAWAAVAETTNAAPEAAPEQKTKSAPQHSGKLLVRMPATLHDELARAAESEGVSLNQLITGVLASAVAWRSDDERGPGARPTAAPDGEEAGTGRLTRVALAANFAVVLIAAAVAIALLIVAWRAGF
jgi:predicted HicB family RNase H-like nuclease